MVWQSQVERRIPYTMAPVPHTTTTMPRDFTPPPQDRNRSQRQDLDAELVDESMGHAPDQRRTLGDGLSPEAIAYKLGQTIGRHTNDTSKH